MNTLKNMKAKSIFGFLVAIFALAFILPTVSAMPNFADVQYIEVNSVILNEQESFAFSAGEELTLRVVFDSANFSHVEEDVRVTARVLGEPGISDVSERFDVLGNRRYSKTLHLQMPRNIDPNERFVLEVTVENNGDVGDVFRVNLELQRSNYQIEILSVENDAEVKAGENLGFDVVVKNRGRKESKDTFVEVRIPVLQLAKRIFLEDLSAVDQGGNVAEKRDSMFGRVFVKIPDTAPAGIYDVEIEAFNDDASALVVKRVSVVGRGVDSTVVTPSTSKTFGVGAEQTYLLTIVNADSKIRVYEIIPETVSGLKITADETVFAVPAGQSKTVKLTVTASREGSFDFAVDINSDGNLVKRQTFKADVEGKAKAAAAGNVAVVLTIVLAVIFVVLLIVLIVLLTRRPEAQEKTQESYY
jgi:hypothetical protein